jgi:hypothetical protein
LLALLRGALLGPLVFLFSAMVPSFRVLVDGRFGPGGTPAARQPN